MRRRRYGSDSFSRFRRWGVLDYQGQIFRFLYLMERPPPPSSPDNMPSFPIRKRRYRPLLLPTLTSGVFPASDGRASESTRRRYSSDFTTRLAFHCRTMFAAADEFRSPMADELPRPIYRDQRPHAGITQRRLGLRRASDYMMIASSDTQVKAVVVIACHGEIAPPRPYRSPHAFNAENTSRAGKVACLVYYIYYHLR